MTTRPPREGEEQMNTYTFVSRIDFEEGIRQNKFLEFGEKDGNLYGTSVDSVRTVIRYVCIFLLATHFIQKNMSTFFSVETSLSTHVAYVIIHCFAFFHGGITFSCLAVLQTRKDVHYGLQPNRSQDLA